jgi:hypothetical protein
VIPAALQALTVHPQFIVYKKAPSESRVGKVDKFPIDHRTGRVSNAHDPSIWLDEAIASQIATTWGESYGVGFVFTDKDPFWFLDIDNCLTPSGWAPHAQQLCQLLPGCAIEVSQSCKGLHLFGTGKPPLHACKNDTLKIEFYHSGRFAALTGINAQGDAAKDFTAELPTLVAIYFPPDASAQLEAEWSATPVPEWRGPEDDSELIRRALQSRSAAQSFGNKASFADLWMADERKLGECFPDDERPYDASRADSALAQQLAFWTGKDCERISRLMRQSKLVRDKWKREDYLPRTILGAVARQNDVLQAALSPALTVPSGTSDELTPHDFFAHLPSHTYINRRTREFHKGDAVNGHLRRFSDSLGMRPSAWLDLFQFVHQMSWQPGEPEIIEGMIADNGHLRPDPTGRIYNLFRPSDAVATDADPAPWLNHVRMLYPDDANHIIKWCAQRIQQPGQKINHALVIGGAQGIGKDLMLEPLRYGVGKCNYSDINPSDLFENFQTWVESTLVVINEARDVGDFDRYKFYEHAKRFIAAPPDTLPCNRKYIPAYNVPNVMGIVITSNHKLSALYLDPDDRRHYVAWSTAERPPASYFDSLWDWMKDGGKSAVVGYLQRIDLSGFDPKAPPPKTEAWHQIVAAYVNPDETALSEAIEDADGNRIAIATVREIVAAVQLRGDFNLATSLQEKRNARKIPQILDRIGYEALRNPNSKDGRWRLGGQQKETLYADRSLPLADRIRLANERCGGLG